MEHYRTEYIQGASEAWLKTGKSDLKTILSCISGSDRAALP